MDGSSRRRMDSDSTNPTKKHDDGHSKGPNIRIVPCNTDLSAMFVDQTQYVAIILPKTMQIAFETFLKEFSKKAMENTQVINLDTEDANDSANKEQESDLESRKQKFLDVYGELKHDLSETLKSFPERELIRDLPQKQFNDFKEHRRKFTKWYVTCQHLANKLANESPSNKYLKTKISYSPAVKDSGIRDSCTAQIHDTEKKCETRLTIDVLSTAQRLCTDIADTFHFAVGHEAEGDTNLKLMMKALRVVLRSHKYLERTRNFYDTRDPEYRPMRTGRSNYPPRRDYHRGNNYNRRPTYPYRDTTRDGRTFQYPRDTYYRSNYAQDYPRPRHQEYDYRRFKRRPASFDEDDVFDEDPEPRSRRHSRRYSSTNDY